MDQAAFPGAGRDQAAATTSEEGDQLSFAEVMRLVQEGKEVPGVRKLDIKPTNQSPAPSRMERIQKPWEISSASKWVCKLWNPRTATRKQGGFKNYRWKYSRGNAAFKNILPGSSSLHSDWWSFKYSLLDGVKPLQITELHIYILLQMNQKETHVGFCQPFLMKLHITLYCSYILMNKHRNKNIPEKVY